ncbi:hypothetical protein [Streptomyces griseocarneus]|uniref:hypothetical protein n=1 Tax=Streptomyces griseocarneus TaxID=51201 RepID=UPI00167C873C|nr:hypothetical protein [Streptomyces griseocarneus]MBZ6475877.1 hypothetical protein [Streptomyces griseocarneus]GHG50248.1 hypothetical protein GCM10018779_10200 [Streptomyces griseocarneus]
MATPSAEPEQAPAATPAPAPSSPRRPELPLWTGNGLPDGKWERHGNALHDYFDDRPTWRLKPDQAAQQPPVHPQPAAAPTRAEAPSDAGLWAGVDEVREAWQEHVPADPSTAEDAWQAILRELRTLDQALQAAGGSPAGPARPAAAAEPAHPTDPEKAAGAVNTALDTVDQHAAAGLRDSPEWQQLQTIRGAARNLWDTLKGRAGEYWHSFREDVRFETFWKTVSIRACEKIAEIAISAADRIHRSTAGDLPTADALLALSNTSLAYSTTARESVAPAL